MTQPSVDGISYDPQPVLQRAYAQIGELMMQRDQLVAAYEAQSAELARLRGTPSVVEASKS